MCKLTGALLMLLAMLPVSAWAEGSVYKWVDEQGVTHYSEALPDDRSANTVESINMEELAPAIIRSEPDRYSVVNQAKRMEEQRLARESDTEAQTDAQRRAELIEAQTAAAEAAAARDTAAVETPPYLLVAPHPIVFVPSQPQHNLPMTPAPTPKSAREPHAVERLANGPGQTAQVPTRTLHRIDQLGHGPYPEAPLFPW